MWRSYLSYKLIHEGAFSSILVTRTPYLQQQTQSRVKTRGLPLYRSCAQCSASGKAAPYLTSGFKILTQHLGVSTWVPEFDSYREFPKWPNHSSRVSMPLWAIESGKWCLVELLVLVLVFFRSDSACVRVHPMS